MQEIREQCIVSATANIQKAQAKQQEDFNQRHKTAYSYKPGDLVLLKNLKRADRKGGGLDTTLFAQRPSGYDSLGFNTVQIHFDENRNHWFTSSTFRIRIEIADSMTPSKLTESAQKQLKSRYECLAKDGCLEVYLINCDQQPNMNDCGLYAIGNSYRKMGIQCLYMTIPRRGNI
ncbi:hypothetical protein E2C01_032378 [Portunus trituberculatus]|uniref:Ubiquitin-like protease family profile domain-containing protein n=1 Tax=Portunus trituberculatus TaxID=210409 RepID=A0A5B7EXC0_PORTR|nr:hypothetical protein [Portunus trituberculatus]